MASGRRELEPTEGELEIVKNHSVAEAARKCARSRDTIRRWRNTYAPEAKMPPGRPRHKPPEGLIEALGTAPDGTLATQFHVPKNTVRNYRLELKISAFAQQGDVTA